MILFFIYYIPVDNTDLISLSLKVFAKFEADQVPVIPMSTLTEEGVMKVKTEACDRLLATRVEVKAKGRKVNDVVNRLHVATPQQRDDKVSCYI